ncbi:iron-sulfur cluster assembly accessory protein [Actinomycetes bacterium NPDC127524]|uniref:heme biosynthesis protein HemY n=1 Tax=unclassified Bacillus (in: firmicutes) TaxID=185979 RepID=UPI0008EA2A55|nr:MULTISPECIES: heme biosynthesis protein HemY [unclassified Bacillus (in: firmicutes)]OIK08839.1 heme biosynthesis protein HemY [Bacillus sp. MUM 13]SFB99893.1 iron-sulfur cluster insertion protein [Bacillus sp. OV322]
MNVKINRNAAKVLNTILASKEAEGGKMIRVVISHMHGDHAHYDIELDTPKEHDEIVKTDKDIDILLDSREEFLDGVWIKYFYVPQEGFEITNPSKDGHAHSHNH